MILVTVSDDRFGRKEGKYKSTQLKMRRLFENNPEFGIKDFIMPTWDEISLSAFYADNKSLLDNSDAARNGRVYKPWAIREALMCASDGEFVVYNDCSPELYPMEEMWPIDLNKFKLSVGEDLCSKNNGILSTFVKWDTRNIPNDGLGIHTHENFTTDLCMRTMGMEQYSKCYMHASGLMMFQKLPHVVDFVDEWLKWNSVPECSALGKPEIPNDYSFWDYYEADHKLGHRHDQSVSGLLINKYGYKLIDLPGKREGLPAYNLLQFFRTDTNYKWIDPNNIPVTERRIKKGDVVINSAGQEITVWEIRPEDGIEWLIVGPHKESCYRTTAEQVTLKSNQ